MVFRKNPFCPQRGSDRNRPALGHSRQRRCGGIVLDAGAGQNSDTRALTEQRNCLLRGRHAERRDRVKKIGDRNVVRRAICGHDVMCDGQVHRPAWLRQHGGETVAKPVIEVLSARDGHGKPRQRPHHRRIVERRLARIRKFAKPFHLERHLTTQNEDRRAIRFRRRDGRRHVAQARPPDADRRTEAPAGAGIAIRHIRRRAFMGRDDRPELGMTRERRQEGVDQAARNHEKIDRSPRAPTRRG